jgi:predicted DNA-binding transcriptional regulator AlpA
MSSKRELSAIEYYSQLDSKQVCRLLGFKSRATLWRWVRVGKLPAPRYPLSHNPRWRLGEIVELLEQQPRFSEAQRGLKGAAQTDVFALFEQDPTQGRKAASVWERLGLRRP